MKKLKQEILYTLYSLKGGKPWSTGYTAYRAKKISELINQRELLNKFFSNDILPKGYGVGIDERCIEYLWVLSRLELIENKNPIYLDAGSSLNHEFILRHDSIRNKKLHIFTLSPEVTRVVDENISYIYGDLRDLPTKDNFYDAIVSISAIEHVGFNNSIFSENPKFIEDSPEDYIKVLKELWRSLKVNGQLMITLPFGKYQKFQTFQQYDLKLLNEFESQIEAPVAERVFYKYTPDGWILSDPVGCADSEYFYYCMLTREERKKTSLVSTDGAASARAVVCLRWVKPKDL